MRQLSYNNNKTAARIIALLQSSPLSSLPPPLFTLFVDLLLQSSLPVFPPSYPSLLAMSSSPPLTFHHLTPLIHNGWFGDICFLLRALCPWIRSGCIDSCTRGVIKAKIIRFRVTLNFLHPSLPPPPWGVSPYSPTNNIACILYKSN